MRAGTHLALAGLTGIVGARGGGLDVELEIILGE